MAIGPIVSGLRQVVAGGAAAAAELLGGQRPRRCWSGNGRAWIELRVPTGSRSPEYAAILEKAFDAAPGVQRAQVNWPLSRLIVEFDEHGPTVDSLIRVIEEIERTFVPAHPSLVPEAPESRGSADDSAVEQQTTVPTFDLPGDAAALVNRIGLLGAEVAALGASGPSCRSLASPSCRGCSRQPPHSSRPSPRCVPYSRMRWAQSVLTRCSPWGPPSPNRWARRRR